MCKHKGYLIVALINEVFSQVEQQASHVHVDKPLHNTVCVEWGSTNTGCLIMYVGPYNGVSSISSDGSV